LATPLSQASDKQLERISKFNIDSIKDLEEWIDSYDNELPPLRNFILPSGGGVTASTLHMSRAICRRLERSIQPLLTAKEVDPNVGVFINRLSDFLFVSARYVAMKEGKTETIYKKN
jgi:cob(I)alamin adenosyltransferase